MIRLLVIAALIVLAYRLFVGRWPWEKRLSTRERALAKARGVLRVPPGVGRSEIVAAHRRLMTEVHPDRGGSSARVHEVNQARDLLLANLPPPVIQHPEEPS
jgi:hypothetical protein